MNIILILIFIFFVIFLFAAFTILIASFNLLLSVLNVRKKEAQSNHTREEINLLYANVLIEY